jgi:hypothetical protein
LAAAFNAQRNPYDYIPEENQRHFWSALVQSAPGKVMYHSLMAVAAKSPLTVNQVMNTLLWYFPRFVGDHRGVLSTASTAVWAESGVLDAL